MGLTVHPSVDSRELDLRLSIPTVPRVGVIYQITCFSSVRMQGFCMAAPDGKLHEITSSMSLHPLTWNNAVVGMDHRPSYSGRLREETKNRGLREPIPRS
jgi:hypothetical protein